MDRWNWQQEDWPRFRYDSEALEELEREFQHNSSRLLSIRSELDKATSEQLLEDTLTSEAFHTSLIEGEHLDRDSIQSSLRRRFGMELAKDARKPGSGEESIMGMMHDLYRTYGEPLSHASLSRWHKLLMKDSQLRNIGRYRRGSEPMQVVSGDITNPKVHFEAPPSERVEEEMAGLIEWFNRTAPGGAEPLPPLARAGMVHIYFESIHPYEDGNGRVGRALSEKVLAQELGRPTLLALATVISKHRREYYGALAQTQGGSEITEWLLYFGQTVLKSVDYADALIGFTVKKYELLDELEGRINERQRKGLERLFKEGPEGFVGGLSAENYMRITKATRPTATRDLADLVTKGALTRSGKLKGTRYQLAIL